jgi:hypothetical protein
MQNSRPLLALLIALLTVAPAMLVAQSPKQKTIRRATPPEFDKSEFDGIFFDNVFEEALVGQRPANLGSPLVNVPRGTGSPAATVGGAPPADSGSAGGVFAWSEIISKETLEDQVKQIKIRVDQSISTPSDFRGRGYLAARRDFTILAMMFGIIGEYDGDVRWKETAAGFREVFSRSAGNAKVGSIQAYNDAKARKADLQDLVGGGSPVVQPAEPAAKWGSVVDRSPLMQMLEATHQGKLQPLIASKNEFEANKAEVRRYAELIAATGEVLTKDSMPDGEDEDYGDFAKRMKAGALKIVDGIELDNYENVRAGAGEISKSCTECHELYRS